MPDHEYPGVHVDEAAGGRPIEGVATDEGQVPAWADPPWFLRLALIGGAMLVSLGILLAIVYGALVAELILMPGGLETLAALFISAMGLWILRTSVERRRRKAGRPQLRITRLIMAIGVVRIAALIAALFGTIALFASLAIGPPATPLLFAIGTNLLFGYIWALFAMRTLSEILLLTAGRFDPRSSLRA